MAFYLRKAFRFGPFRLNLSKGGLGISAGVKGLRIGAGPLTRNGVWRVVKGPMAAVGLDPRYAAHTCRNTYATHLYRASDADLEVVQEQVGHASIKTTTIYARVTKEDKLKVVNALANAHRESRRVRTERWPGLPRTIVTSAQGVRA